MSENLNSNNIENDEINLINEDSDYKNLITRLNAIKSTISLLEETNIAQIVLLLEIIHHHIIH